VRVQGRWGAKESAELAESPGLETVAAGERRAGAMAEPRDAGQAVAPPRAAELAALGVVSAAQAQVEEPRGAAMVAARQAWKYWAAVESAPEAEAELRANARRNIRKTYFPREMIYGNSDK
jgi:hypothetical protein